MLDILLFREDKGGKPDLIRESQKRRYADVKLVDIVIEKDNEWRKERRNLDSHNKFKNKIGKQISKIKKSKNKELEGKPTDTIPQDFLDKLTNLIIKGTTKDQEDELSKLTFHQLKKLSTDSLNGLIIKIKDNMSKLETERNQNLCKIGNIVHESVVVSNDEINNGIVKKYVGSASDYLKKLDKKQPEKLLNHVDLMYKIEGIDTTLGNSTAGSRGYYLMGPLVLLNLGIIHYSMEFLQKRGYQPMYVPFFMKKSMMGKVAQLDEFDEALYKVSDGKENTEDMYLIATSEQPLCAYHYNQNFNDSNLPKKYAGFSTNFRKEAGSHGRDTLGIFRVHQFDKIEQFAITSPKEGKSWEMFEGMLKTAEEFYQSLGLGYQVVNIVSGKLNNSCAKKFDLEAIFPASKTFRELVSCSNCTDYQSRRLNVRFGHSKKGNQEKQFVHMLNATLCATTRTMCCICENYQTEEGIVVPEVLRKYVGLDFIPFKKQQNKKTKNKKPNKKND